MDITVKVTVKAPIDLVWQKWITPTDICAWNAASDDWHTTRATVDLKVNGKFTSRMEAKDGSFGFDFSGTYTRIETSKLIAYRLEDNRNVSVRFSHQNGITTIEETFTAEEVHSTEQQREGWQAILDNFARYVHGIPAK